MADANSRSTFSAGEPQPQTPVPASVLMPVAARAGLGTSSAPARFSHFGLARRLFVTTVTCTFTGLALGVLLVCLLAPGALPWMVGVVLALALVGVIVLGAHAGGHGWFVPVPVLILAAAWALAASAGPWSSPGAWALAALSFAAAVVAAALVLPAIAFRKSTLALRGPAGLPGADGIALTDLAPTGIAKVNNETWTAQSISGALPAGAPVHVVRVEGVRLLVWSEAGHIPGPEALSSLTNPEKEAL